MDLAILKCIKEALHCKDSKELREMCEDIIKAIDECSPKRKALLDM